MAIDIASCTNIKAKTQFPILGLKMKYIGEVIETISAIRLYLTASEKLLIMIFPSLKVTVHIDKHSTKSNQSIYFGILVPRGYGIININNNCFFNTFKL